MSVGLPGLLRSHVMGALTSVTWGGVRGTDRGITSVNLSGNIAYGAKGLGGNMVAAGTENNEVPL